MDEFGQPLRISLGLEVFDSRMRELKAWVSSNSNEMHLLVGYRILLDPSKF